MIDLRAFNGVPLCLRWVIVTVRSIRLVAVARLDGVVLEQGEQVGHPGGTDGMSATAKLPGQGVPAEAAALVQ